MTSPEIGPQQAPLTTPREIELECSRLRLLYAAAAARAHLALSSTPSPGAAPASARGTPSPASGRSDRRNDLDTQLKAALEKTATARMRAELARSAVDKLRSTPKSGSPVADAQLLDRLAVFLNEVFVPTTEVLEQGLRAELHPARRPEADKVVAGAVPKETAASRYRAQYNVACYWSTRAGHQRGRAAESLLDSARSALLRALQAAPRDDQRKLGAWARLDPSLERLRTSDRGGPGLAGLLQLYAPEPAPPVEAPETEQPQQQRAPGGAGRRRRAT